MSSSCDIWNQILIKKIESKQIAFVVQKASLEMSGMCVIKLIRFTRRTSEDSEIFRSQRVIYIDTFYYHVLHAHIEI